MIFKFNYLLNINNLNEKGSRKIQCSWVGFLKKITQHSLLARLPVVAMLIQSWMPPPFDHNWRGRHLHILTSFYPKLLNQPKHMQMN